MADRKVHCSPGVAASTSQFEFGSRALPPPVLFTVIVNPAGCGSIAELARVTVNGLAGDSAQKVSSKATSVMLTQPLELKASAKHFVRRVDFIVVLLTRSRGESVNSAFAVTEGCVVRTPIPSG